MNNEGTADHRDIENARFLLVQKMARDLYLEAKQLLDSGFFTNVGRKIDPIVVMGELEKTTIREKDERVLKAIKERIENGSL